jgi:hypothetical protein
VIIIINLELYKSPLEMLTYILLTLLLAGQYIMVIWVMAPEWSTMGLSCSSPAVSTVIDVSCITSDCDRVTHNWLSVSLPLKTEINVLPLTNIILGLYSDYNHSLSFLKN